MIDALLQCAVLGFEDDPPVSPADGDQYIVGTGTGAWVGQDNNLAQWVGQGAFWNFYEAGKVKLVKFGDELRGWNGTAWVLIGGLSDAPSDGNKYGRQDGVWVVITEGGGGLPLIVTEAGTALTADNTNAGNYTRFTNAAAKTYTFDDGEIYTAADDITAAMQVPAN